MDAVIADYASERHGVVAHRELVALGLGPRAISYRLRSGRLHELQRGVYALGHRALTPDAARRAAVLAGGPGAVLSHRSAAGLHELRRDSRTTMEITVPRSRRDRPGVRQRYVRLGGDEVTVVRRIPVTNVARTLLDLAALLAADQLAAAIREAEFRRVFDRAALERLLNRYPRRHGTRALRGMLGAGVDLRLTRSELERRFLAFLLRARLPRPETNVSLQLNGTTIEVDCLWRSQRVALELDGQRAHATRSAFERDRRRDRMLSVAGWRPVRVTWAQLACERAELEADLRTLLT